MFIKFKKKIKRIYFILFIPKYKFVIKTKSAIKKYSILDIGCGGNSPYQTKLIFPNSRYVGVDRDFNYHNDKNSIKYFKSLKELNSSLELRDLSMGMSADYNDAVTCGATYLRIGSLIFGNRS